MLDAVGTDVLGLDLGGQLAPDLLLALGLAEEDALLVNGPVGVDEERAGEDGSDRGPDAKLFIGHCQCNKGDIGRSAYLGQKGGRVRDPVHGGRGVERGDPRAHAPADVVAKAVVHDVDRPEVARLPDVELGEVDQLDGDRDEEGVRDVANLLVLWREGFNYAALQCNIPA